MSESCTNSMFNISNNFPTVFQSGCTILHSYQQCLRVPVFSHAGQNPLLSVFLIVLYNLITYVGLCIHHLGQDPEQ